MKSTIAAAGNSGERARRRELCGASVWSSATNPIPPPSQARRRYIAPHGSRRNRRSYWPKPPPDQLARFRRWFTAFEAGRTEHAEELDSSVTKLGRLAGSAFGESKKRAKEAWGDNPNSAHELQARGYAVLLR